MRIALQLAGIGQIILALASPALPRILRWREQTRRLEPLTRHVFWTYAGYILATNLCFGLLSLLAPGWLLDGAPLATAVAAYITLYWGARLVLQLVFRKHAPAGLPYRLADGAVLVLFLYLTVVYATVALR